VFVSSTLEELAAERAAARAAIEQLRLAPVMFEAGARAHPPQAVYQAYLEQSDGRPSRGYRGIAGNSPDSRRKAGGPSVKVCHTPRSRPAL